MNAHPIPSNLQPSPKPLPCRCPTLRPKPDAGCRKILVPVFEAGRSIDAAALRAAMEDACGASDTSGAWVWKDAYEAADRPNPYTLRATAR